MALWIIILALIAGILLLALIIFGLTKVTFYANIGRKIHIYIFLYFQLGFFKREKKEELKNLKAAVCEDAYYYFFKLNNEVFFDTDIKKKIVSKMELNY